MVTTQPVCGQCVVTVQPVCGHHMVSLWSPCSPCVVSAWSPCSQFVVTMWSVCGHYAASVWSACGHHVVSVWSATQSAPLFQTVRHGFPYQPTAMAFDPVQNLLAIGTKTGSLRMYPSSHRNVGHIWRTFNLHQNVHRMFMINASFFCIICLVFDCSCVVLIDRYSVFV